MAKSMENQEYEGYPHYSFVFKFEETNDLMYWKAFMDKRSQECFYIAGVYLLLVVGLRSYMKNRAPLNIRGAVLLWNISLAAFSIMGSLRVLPEFMYVIRHRNGFEMAVCNTGCNNVTAFWVTAFVLSKAPELMDTVFLVLKKQKLTALHLIHHTLTLLVTWYFFKYLPALGRMTIVMNFSVHALMYSYFALKTAKIYVPEAVSKALTLAQIAQMVIGLASSLYVIYINTVLGHKCGTTVNQAYLFLAMYSLFGYMFINFFLHRYNIIGSKNKKVD